MENGPRPFGLAISGKKRKELLQLVYIELGTSENDGKYVLRLRDGYSDYKWFFFFPGTIAENAASLITKCRFIFGVPNALMSDWPAHYNNDTVRLVTIALKAPHHFTLLYCP